MTDSPGPHDFVYVDTDIPDGDDDPRMARPARRRHRRRAAAAARPSARRRRPGVARGGAGPRPAEDRARSRAWRPASGAAPRGAPEPRSHEHERGQRVPVAFRAGLPVTGNRVARASRCAQPRERPAAGGGRATCGAGSACPTCRRRGCALAAARPLDEPPAARHGAGVAVRVRRGDAVRGPPAPAARRRARLSGPAARRTEPRAGRRR